jgi:2-aminoadipate transaminase
MIASPHAAKNEPSLAQWVQRLSLSSLQKALKAAADPSILSLSLGLPDPALFPVTALAEASARVSAANPNVLQYTLPSEELKDHICRHMRSRGVECSTGNIFLTVGAQEGLSLLARLLLDPGASIFEEEFSYPAFQQTVEPYSPNVIAIPSSSSTGIDVDALAQALEYGPRPALVYLMTDGHNPLGATVPIENRERLAGLAREFRVPIIEDDPYGSLCYEGNGIPPLRALERDWVYYVGSFSKILAPSLRIGWLVVPHELIQPLSIVKEACNLNLSTFAQWIVSEYLETDPLPLHIQALRTEYGSRRDAMETALRATFPGYCRWHTPTTGVFFWIDLPETINATELLRTAIECERVAFIPAEAFSRGRHLNGMRLNFSRCTPNRIEEAVARIASLL